MCWTSSPTKQRGTMAGLAFIPQCLWALIKGFALISHLVHLDQSDKVLFSWTSSPSISRSAKYSRRKKERAVSFKPHILRCLKARSVAERVTCPGSMCLVTGSELRELWQGMTMSCSKQILVCIPHNSYDSEILKWMTPIAQFKVLRAANGRRGNCFWD